MSSLKSFNLIRLSVCSSAAILLSGCATGTAVRDEGAEAPLVAEQRASAPVKNTNPTPPAPARPAGDRLQGDSPGAEASPEARAPTLITGNDRVVKLPSAKAVQISQSGAISLKFEQAPVTDVVHAVLGDLLKVGYTIHQPIGGEVTVHTRAPVPPSEVLAILESVLAANGLMLAQDAQGVFHVGRPEAVRGIGSTPRSIKALTPGQGMVVVPLQYVSAAEMAEILRPVAPAEAFVRVDTVRNLLMLAGSRNQIDSWLEFVEIFDVDMLKGMSVGLFPLEHASVKEIDAALRAVTGLAPSAGGGGEATQQQAQPGTAAPAQMRQLPAFGPLGGVVRVIPIERLNALLVVTPRAHYLQQAREWIARLDRPTEGGSEPQLYVYPVQNGTSQHLAGLLSAVFGGTGQQAGTKTQTDSGVAQGLSTSTRGMGMSSAMSAATSGTNTTGQQGPAISQVALGPQVRVVADEFNNALLIHAPRSEYRKIEAALRRLDLAPTQVLIEASILEVTLTDETKFGLQWFFENEFNSGHTGSGVLTEGGINLAPAVPGFSYTLTNSLGQVRAVLNALAKKSLLNVISSPSVMVLDNHTATIHVGDQQPVPGPQTVTDGGVITSSITYKDTGVMLSVTPSANAGGMVTMTIKQSVTDVGSVDVATRQRSFLQREVASRVAVRSGETVVLGGLMRDNNNNGKQGVPWLHEIPVLGYLFGATTISNVRTELLVMITPRVVQGDQDLRELGAEMRRRMDSLRVLPEWDRLNPDAVVEPPAVGEVVPVPGA